MKNVYSLKLLFVALLCSVTLTSCLGDDDEDTSENCYEKLQGLAQDAQSKGEAFGYNPNKTNCTAWKEATTKYYNAAKQCGDKQMIDAANVLIQQLNTVNCNDW
jgi:hypothetical protein